MTKRLTPKQKAFVLSYCETLNGTEAARRAKYKGNDNTLAAVAYENLRKPHILAAIDDFLKDYILSAEETLVRLSLIARGNLGEILTTEMDDETGRSWVFMDLEKVKNMGHLVQEIGQNQHGYKVKFYSALSALETMAKYHKLLTERIEHDGTIELETAGGLTDDNLVKRAAAIIQQREKHLNKSN